ncbi:MAG: hypothetical protein N2321_00180 [Melioribacteraceae bacterium]|nr:hypothetical protein [Melioribacteraceae bacterium]
MQKYLLNYKLKFVGLVLLIPSFIIAFIRFYIGNKLEFFDTKVFAFYSYYLEKKFFVVIENHISEEIAGIFLLISLFLIAFSKEKNENELTSVTRAKSLILSFYFNFIFLLFSFAFTYGFAFMDMLLINIFSQFIFYILIFRINLILSKFINKQ